MIPIIILLTLIVTLILQERFFKNKKNYKNKYIKVYQELKVPIFVTCIVVIIYDIMIQPKPEISPDLFMKQPCF